MRMLRPRSGACCYIDRTPLCEAFLFLGPMCCAVYTYASSFLALLFLSDVGIVTHVLKRVNRQLTLTERLVVVLRCAVLYKTRVLLHCQDLVQRRH